MRRGTKIDRARVDKRRLRERRRDEKSLYYIIERDLGTEAIFKGHEGWKRQIKLPDGIIDYALKYGNYVFGIEVKFDFPVSGHFDQVVDLLPPCRKFFLCASLPPAFLSL